jgi:hypothetical protein
VSGPTPKPFWDWVEPAGDCWVWTGGRTGDGYGSWWDGQRSRSAHLIAFELLTGAPPTGVGDHLCRVRACVNPDHVEITTMQVNTLRGSGPTATNARKSRCPAGHAYDSESRGRRVCLTCKREKTRAARARKAA